jgi:hypothetical protein
MTYKKMVYIRDEDVLSYLEKQNNQSAYIVDLIKKDMYKETINKEMIIKIIEEYLNKNSAQSDNFELMASMESVFNL